MIGSLALVLLLQGAAPSAEAPVVSARRSPEAPGIGEPIVVELRVRAPLGTEVRFPVLADTGTRLEPLDPREIRDASTTTRLDRSAVYRLIAWDTGSVSLTWDDIVLVQGGVERRYPVTLAPIQIRSLLPSDTALRVPQPAREPVETYSWHWRLWLAIAVIAALAWWGLRRWREERAEWARRAAEDAGRIAREGFAHAATLELLAAGEAGRHLLMHVTVLRRYLARRWPGAGAHLTATELHAALRDSPFPILPDRVVGLVARAESVAYARAPIAAEEAETLGVAAQGIGADLETALEVRREQEDGLRRDARRIKRKALR